jgi:hypothetical protein
MEEIQFNADVVILADGTAEFRLRASAPASRVRKSVTKVNVCDN